MPDEDDVDDFYVELGVRVRRERQKVKMTQASLGVDIGLTRSSIANLEAGRQRVPAHVLAAIAASLDIPLDELVPTAGHRLGGRHDVGRQDLERYSDTALRFVHDGLNSLSAGPGAR